MASTIGEPHKPQRTNKRGLTQAYDIRDFAAETALDLKAVEATSLEDKATRARALRDAASVWNTASQAIRVLRNPGLPKSVLAFNDPARKRLKPRRPVRPIGPSAVFPDGYTGLRQACFSAQTVPTVSEGEEGETGGRFVLPPCFE